MNFIEGTTPDFLKLRMFRADDAICFWTRNIFFVPPFVRSLSLCKVFLWGSFPPVTPSSYFWMEMLLISRWSKAWKNRTMLIAKLVRCIYLLYLFEMGLWTCDLVKFSFSFLMMRSSDERAFVCLSIFWSFCLLLGKLIYSALPIATTCKKSRYCLLRPAVVRSVVLSSVERGPLQPRLIMQSSGFRCIIANEHLLSVISNRFESNNLFLRKRC